MNISQYLSKYSFWPYREVSMLILFLRYLVKNLVMFNPVPGASEEISKYGDRKYVVSNRNTWLTVNMWRFAAFRSFIWLYYFF